MTGTGKSRLPASGAALATALATGYNLIDSYLADDAKSYPTRRAYYETVISEK